MLLARPLPAPTTLLLAVVSVLAAVHVADLGSVLSAHGWQRGHFTVVTVPVDFAGYRVRVGNHTWLSGGMVGLQCGG
eukprot:SAG31_NODE_21909_length_538_cov_0.701595_1_plen_76_part_10